MELTGWILFFAFVFTAIVALVGGKLTIGPKGISMDTKGVIDAIRKAREEKGIEGDADSEDVAPVSSQKLPTATVLWVDDSTENNIYERLALAKMGVHVECYTTNDLALSVLELVDPNLVVSDISRSLDENGWELLTSVREKKPDLPFIFYTGSVSDDRARKATEGGATGIFSDPADLVRAIASQLFPT